MDWMFFKYSFFKANPRLSYHRRMKRCYIFINMPLNGCENVNKIIFRIYLRDISKKMHLSHLRRKRCIHHEYKNDKNKLFKVLRLEMLSFKIFPNQMIKYVFLLYRFVNFDQGTCF